VGRSLVVAPKFSDEQAGDYMQKVDTIFKGGNRAQISVTSAADVKPPVRFAVFSGPSSLPRSNGRTSGSSLGGEGLSKLRTKLIAHGLPETVADELIEHQTPVNYPKGSMIFLQGAPTDLIYWVSSGLVDILCPEPEGGQIQTSLLGPGDIFGFVEFSDFRGKPAQAFQSRARTNVQLGLITRDRVSKVLGRLDPPLLVHLLGEITAVWGSFTHYCAQFLGMNYSERFETVLRDLTHKFGVRETRGTLLIPEFGHGDFAEMIGSSRPMVSRLIAEMIANQRLAYDGRHYIVIGDSTMLPTKS
jgi:CRP/FNR family transcriptional regulator, cyclic AMP receptor protein